MVLFANSVTKLLEGRPVPLTIYAFISAFVTYFCMYAFRKPFTAATYECPDRCRDLYGIQLKIALVTVQVVGYTISKFSGIVIISTLNKNYRGLYIIFALLIAELALLGVGAVSSLDERYSVIFMFINGLPLGLIWGIVFSFVEGRETSEFLATGMCISFIIASGIVKSVGAAMVQSWHVDQYWMPAFAGAVFFPFLIIGTYLLELLPEPSIKDVEKRTRRVPMTHADRVRMLKTFWPGLVVNVLFYMTLTAIRDFRDNFAPELWLAFGQTREPAVFTITEVAVGIVVVIPIVLFMVYIKTNMNTLVAYHILIFAGMIVVAGVAFVYNLDPGRQSTGMVLMIGTGIGLYFAYVPFSQIIWDLMLATFQYPATSGFLMYVCDSLGYLSSVAVLMVKNFLQTDARWDTFYVWMCFGMAGTGIVCTTISLAYYWQKAKGWSPPHPDMVSVSMLSLQSKEEE
jgi:hypothetical protein